jgi:hypothetical protein
MGQFGRWCSWKNGSHRLAYLGVRPYISESFKSNPHTNFDRDYNTNSISTSTICFKYYGLQFVYNALVIVEKRKA